MDANKRLSKLAQVLKQTNGLVVVWSDYEDTRRWIRTPEGEVDVTPEMLVELKKKHQVIEVKYDWKNPGCEVYDEL